jgi:hypothetical protein
MVCVLEPGCLETSRFFSKALLDHMHGKADAVFRGMPRAGSVKFDKSLLTLLLLERKCLLERTDRDDGRSHGWRPSQSRGGSRAGLRPARAGC